VVTNRKVYKILFYIIFRVNKMVKYSELRAALEGRHEGGTVKFFGDSSTEAYDIGMGIMLLFAKIPEEGIRVEDIVDEHDRVTHKRWLEGTLSQAGLVEERDGRFFVSETARGKEYTLQFYQRDGLEG
jgi:hypothetical protein